MRHIIYPLFILLASCDSIYTTAVEAERLVTISAEWNGDLSNSLELAGISTSTPLRATLIWADVPNFSPFCLKEGFNPLEPNKVVTSTVAKLACPDPFRFVSGETQGSALIDLSARQVDISLVNLPPAEVLVGSPGERVGYASVVVFADLNSNGIIDQGGRCRRPERDGKDGNRVDESQEPILAASFVNLTEAHERIVYLEGQFDEDSYFYPALGCEKFPTSGFSLWRIGENDCTLTNLNERIRLNIASPDIFKPMQCGPGRKDYAREPREKKPADRAIIECLSESEFALVDPTCSCPDPVLYQLKGCERDFICETPEWDYSNDPPEWWPCLKDGK